MDSTDPAYYPVVFRISQKKKCLNSKDGSVGEGENAGRRGGGRVVVSYRSPLGAAECGSVF